MSVVSNFSIITIIAIASIIIPITTISHYITSHKQHHRLITTTVTTLIHILILTITIIDTEIIIDTILVMTITIITIFTPILTVSATDI